MSWVSPSDRPKADIADGRPACGSARIAGTTPDRVRALVRIYQLGTVDLARLAWVGDSRLHPSHPCQTVEPSSSGVDAASAGTRYPCGVDDA